MFGILFCLDQKESEKGSASKKVRICLGNSLYCFYLNLYKSGDFLLDVCTQLPSMEHLTLSPQPPPPPMGIWRITQECQKKNSHHSKKRNTKSVKRSKEQEKNIRKTCRGNLENCAKNSIPTTYDTIHSYVCIYLLSVNIVCICGMLKVYVQIYT